MPRWAASTDTNQAAMVTALEAVGFSVLLLHRAGEGIHDLAVGARNTTLMVEVKMPGEDLTPKQKVIHANYTGAQIVAYDPVDVLNWFYNEGKLASDQYKLKVDRVLEIYMREMLKITQPQLKRKYTRKARGKR